VTTAAAPISIVPDAPADTETKAKVVRTNEHLKWKPRCLGMLRHLGEKFPEHSKAVASLLSVVDKLPEDYNPTAQTSAPKVGDVVRLPEHDALFRGLKIENKGRVVNTERGVSTVDVGGHNFTVPNRTIEVLERA